MRAVIGDYGCITTQKDLAGGSVIKKNLILHPYSSSLLMTRCVEMSQSEVYL